MKPIILSTILFGCATLAHGAPADTNTPSEEAKKIDGIDSWKLGFGLGVEQYRDDYIESASIHGDTKIVTVDQSFETRPSAWLTVNWNIWGLNTNIDQSSCIDLCNTKWGLFAGVKLLDANSQAFSSFALGPQVSFQTKMSVISIGFGWVTHGTKTLANGIQEGAPLPSQYDEIAYKEGTENSYMLMMSIGVL